MPFEEIQELYSILKKEPYNENNENMLMGLIRESCDKRIAVNGTSRYVFWDMGFVHVTSNGKFRFVEWEE